MNESSSAAQLRLPDDLQSKLTEFQHRVWWIKAIEGVSIGLIGLMLSFILVFFLDRVWDTPWWCRLAILLTGSLGMIVLLPAKIRRWVWNSRQLVDVARLLRHRHPRLGDRLLGIVELAQATHPLRASPELCRAAIQQVADDTRELDFTDSVPTPRHVTFGVMAAVVGLFALIALMIPSAGINAFQRWAAPWIDTPRYTFAQLTELPEELVVPIGEPFSLQVGLAEGSVWHPKQGSFRYGWQDSITAPAADGTYEFHIPAQKQPAVVKIAVGDAVHRMNVVPASRPELMTLLADVKLPKYLGHPKQQRDVRGGSITLVRGSSAVFAATATRNLANATINGEPNAQLQGPTIVSPAVHIEEPSVQRFTWTDIKGLSSKQPFQLRVRPADDEAPFLQCRDLAREKVVLDEEVLTFQVSAEDDFGVKRVGVEWRGVPKRGDVAIPASGEYLLKAGGQQAKDVEVQGTFSAKKLGIDPQPIELRVFAEDYLPGRERSYSPVYRIYVLSAEQHMIWITQKLQDWQRQVLEVRDEEQRLYDRNLEFRQLSADELDNPAARRKIGQQAAAERANGRRLENLTLGGEQLIAQAIRNSQFNTNTLENWAKSLQSLKKLAANRMPSVANLLDQAAGAPSASGESEPPKAPSVVDIEASANEEPTGDKKPPSNGEQKAPPGKLGLAATVVKQTTPSNPNAAACPAGEKIDEALDEQKELLAEFNRLMDEMSKILGDLQGSTFVKRLKFAARREKMLASTLHKRLRQTFGKVKQAVEQGDKDVFEELYHQQIKTADDVSIIQEDLLAYFQRTQESKFNQVYREMKDVRVTTSLREVSRGVVDNLSGESIAEAEYWIDQLDRWADILVGPG